MGRGGSRVNSRVERMLRRVTFLKGQAMDGRCRVERPLLELRREFVGSRLEAQVLARTYELVVPVIRMPVAAGMPPDENAGTNRWNRTGRIAQGA